MIIVFIRSKYAQPNNTGVVCGCFPSPPRDKYLVGNVILAYISISKYVDHLPLFPLHQIFKQNGTIISPTTIDGWIIKLGALVEPLYNAMANVVKTKGYIQVDKSCISILDRPKKGKCHRGYHWLYHALPKKMVVVDYQHGCDVNAPRHMLKDYKGHLQPSGYQVYMQYGNIKGVTHLTYWEHTRGYSIDAQDQDKACSDHAQVRIQALYTLERNAKDMTPEKRKKLRLEKSLPILNEFGKCLSEENKKTLPKRLIGKAFACTINLWDYLQHYFHNGELQIDDNLIKNSFRLIALGRKNHLFADSHAGAQRSAMLYMFTGYCKMHNSGVNGLPNLSTRQNTRSYVKQTI